MVGEVDESGSTLAYKIFTHKKIDIGYNQNQIVDINLTSDGRVLLAPNVKLDFSYEVTWKESGISFTDRFDKYLDPSFFQHRVGIVVVPPDSAHFHFIHWKVVKFSPSDSLVLNIQLVHDGDISGRARVNDIDADVTQGLRTLFERWGDGWYGRHFYRHFSSLLFNIIKRIIEGTRFGRWIRLETSARGRVPAADVSDALLSHDWDRISDLYRVYHCHHVGHIRGALHWVGT